MIFLGKEEPSVTLEFIPYPKSVYNEKDMVNGILSFTKKIMTELEQNRAMIVFPHETLMLENSAEIDPRNNIT
jgi:hypothetical protein